LARLQPYDPKKIPIMCIHGLGDSQATWAPMIETLRGDPEIRKNYQFWFFTFPTGYPYPLMAEELRKDMNAMNAAYPGHKDFVVIGHSTGGMIARELITDSGMKIWNAYFDVPPRKMPLSKDARKVLEGSLIFKPRHDVSRVIFASASLRGSEVAVGWIGKLGRKLIGNSVTLGDMDDTMKAVSLAKPAATGEPILAMPNSIDALDPENRFLLTINNIKPTPGIPYHSIIGDRGKGGNLDKTKPMSTDGLVPYWSSHIDGAKSELVIPSGHWTNQDPTAIAEVRRILMEHIGKR
ncbi:MAG: esterase/lipase family protein, partial [Verrucomicrobium sp.]